MSPPVEDTFNSYKKRCEYVALVNSASITAKNSAFTISHAGSNATLKNSVVTNTQFPDGLVNCLATNISRAVTLINIKMLIDMYNAITTKSTNDNSSSTSTAVPAQSLVGPSTWVDYDLLELCSCDQVRFIIYNALVMMFKINAIVSTYPGGSFSNKEKATSIAYSSDIDTATTGIFATLLPFLDSNAITKNTVTIGDIYKHVLPNQQSSLSVISNNKTYLTSHQKYCHTIVHDIDESIIFFIDIKNNNWLTTLMFQSSFVKKLLIDARLELKLANTELAKLKHYVANENGDYISPKNSVLVNELTQNQIQNLQLITPSGGASDLLVRFLHPPFSVVEELAQTAADFQGDNWDGGLSRVSNSGLPVSSNNNTGLDAFTDAV